MDRCRLIFSSPAAPREAFGSAGEAIRAWLAASSGDPAILAHTAASSPEGGQAEQWRLSESSRDGARGASLTLTVHAPALLASAAGIASTWFWVEDARRAGPPEVRGLVRGLLNAVAARDSMAVLASEPVITGTDGLDELIDVLCDPGRRLPAMVAAAHPAVSFAEWSTTISQVTRDAAGLASTYLLDPAGTDGFNDALGPTHGVWGGALRTYLPDVDPALPDDGRRHRVMLATRMTDDPRRVSVVLADFPRRLARDAPLPLALAGVTRMLLTQAQEPGAQGVDAERDAGDVTQGEHEVDLESPARHARQPSPGGRPPVPPGACPTEGQVFRAGG